ncbi:MAG: hypothetical protein JST54_28100 [Deltaproteobacteria bacterium]|nr:hypothetical protein [Deltaproteobacteria bacterium]
MRPSFPRLAALVLLVGVGCSHTHIERVTVPPQVDLTHYTAVALIDFSSPANRGQLPSYATHQFLQRVLEAQPNARIMQLGTLQQALASVGKSQLDADAIRAIGQKNGAQAVFAGTLELTDAKPTVSVANFAHNVGVSADVNANLAATLYDAGNGTIVWTSSAAAHDSAGGVSLNGGDVGVGVEGTDNAYTRMIQKTTWSIADPFRAHVVKQRVEDAQ